MSIDFSFVEYSVPPESLTDGCAQLVTLGFVPRVEHAHSGATLWTQKHSILMLRESSAVDAPRVTGLGFLAEREDIERLGAQYDADVNMYVTHDKASLRILLACTDNILNLKDDQEGGSYLIVDDRTRDHHAFSKISGIIYSCNDPRMMDFFQDVGFRFTKSGDRYNNLVSSNNRFTIVCDKEQQDGAVPALICDCPDVFASTSTFKVRGFDLKNYEVDAKNLDFGNLNHKIAGYNCYATGNENSYSIENMILGAMPNLDIIFRSRRQYLHITENTLRQHYDQSKRTNSTPE